ncbi:restriction endonuclease [Campylobacter concisus]|uniref:restriction endonuclease n=1 Tax=Campylobacter concisus TaxID=199 RepID=UPI0021561F58|nr:restriction endonuclease [Campylobacter concisus]
MVIIAFKTTNIDEILSSILEKMDYETGCLTNKGLDGIMDEPRLSKIYKRYKDSSSIGGQEIQQVLSQIKMPKKGVFITTAKFTKEAQTFAKDSQNFSVVLIDGDRLAELMTKYKVGVQTSQIYEICKIDTDFFDENNF